MRTPPPGASSTTVWRDFNEWADSKLVPHEAEDWEYLWECYLAGAAAGSRQVARELIEETDRQDRL